VSLKSTRIVLLDGLLVARARELRKQATDAEALLWRHLRNRRLGGFKFRRQQPLGSFVLDFYCEEAKLAVELDGGGHAEKRQARYDASRTAWLGEQGIRVVRFWDSEVLKDTKAVLEEILRVLTEES
jgi:very-short-patch-repair endonuclease